MLGRKFHTACLNSLGTTYIFVGQLHLMPVGFKMKSNMVSEPILDPLMGLLCLSRYKRIVFNVREGVGKSHLNCGHP